MNKTIQQTLALVIDDYLLHYHMDREESFMMKQISVISPTTPGTGFTTSSDVVTEKPESQMDSGSIPEYVRELFRHYCVSQQNPDIDDMDRHRHQIHGEMIPELRCHFFIGELMNTDPQIDLFKIKKLFPSSNIELPPSKPSLVSRGKTLSRLLVRSNISLPRGVMRAQSE